MRLCVNIVLKPAAKSSDLGIRQGRKFSIEPNQADHARNLQDPNAFFDRDLYKDVPWKQSQIHQLAAVLPAVQASVKRQKSFNRPLFQLLRNHLLVTHGGVNRIPQRRTLNLVSRRKCHRAPHQSFFASTCSFATSLTSGICEIANLNSYFQNHLRTDTSNNRYITLCSAGSFLPRITFRIPCSELSTGADRMSDQKKTLLSRSGA